MSSFLHFSGADSIIEEPPDVQVDSDHEDNNKEDHIFSCRMENIKLLIDLLSSLCLDVNKDHDCLIEATSDGKYILNLFVGWFYFDFNGCMEW